MDISRLDAHKKWLDALSSINARHADFTKFAASSAFEYGKIIVQSLFALNAAGIVATQFLFLNLTADTARKFSVSYLWSASFFLVGFGVTLLMCLFMYRNFMSLYENASDQYAEEVSRIHNYVYGSSDFHEFDEKYNKRKIEFYYVMANLTAWISFISFCFGCFALFLRVKEYL